MSGCASTKNYLTSRAADLLDIWQLECSAGPGAHANIYFTDYFGTGLGYSVQYGIWIHGRYVGGGPRTSEGLIFISTTEGTIHDGGPQLGRSTLIPLLKKSPYSERAAKITEDSRGSVLFCEPALLAFCGSETWEDYRKVRWWRGYDITAGASLGLGLHVCFSPGELLDFLTGWAMLDFTEDDIHDGMNDQEKPLSQE